jgi:hypothetical protein
MFSVPNREWLRIKSPLIYFVKQNWSLIFYARLYIFVHHESNNYSSLRRRIIYSLFASLSAALSIGGAN